MKKKSVIFLSLAILLCVLAVIGGFLLFFGRSGGNDEARLSESTDISLDFSELTDGRWEYRVDYDSPEMDTWQDQIYTDSYTVNSAMTRLVPASGQKKLSGGWNEAHDTYISVLGSLRLYATGLKPGAVYRVALFVPRADGGTGLYCSAVTGQEKGEKTQVCDVELSCHPGCYRDLTIVITGNGEIYTHTFQVQIQNVSGQTIRNRNDGYLSGLYYDTQQRATAAYVRKDGPVPTADFTKASSGISICAPQDKDVYTGFDGAGMIECSISLDRSYDPQEGRIFEVSYRLTELAAGQEVCSGTARGELRSGDGFSWLTASVMLPPVLSEGDYSLCAEVFRLDSGSEAQGSAAGVSMGTDTVTFCLQKEYNLSEIYGQYLRKEPSSQQACEAYQSASGIMEELSERGVILYESAVFVPEIKEYLASMEGFDTDMFNKFLRYRYAQSQDMIGSFALSAPNVPESEQVDDREDLLFTANWLLRDSYVFQTKDIKHYADAQIMNVEQMKAFHGDSWKELAAMDYATGAARDSDGTVYIWLPVYYEDDQGGIANNELYLFVYILHQGADTAYLDATNYYNSEFYNDYRTTKLLITDQNVVASMLDKLNRANRALFAQEDTNDYPTLYRSMEGEYVRRLQRRLQRLGYLTTSVDAVFTKPVEEAVLAWQRDMGLKESYEVSPQMQRMLHDTAPYRQLLMAWLNDHYE